MKRQDILLSILSGLLVVVAFPTWEWVGCIWISFIPLFYALRRKTARQAFWLGFIMGAVISLGGFYWVIHTLQEFGRLPLIAALPLFLIFCAFSNLHIPLFTWLLVKFPLKVPPLFWVPALYTVVEYLFPQIFSWTLGACLYKKLWLIQTAEITGVYGMSFLVMLLNVFIYELIRWILKETLTFPKFSLSISLGLIILSVSFSALQFRNTKEALTHAPTLRAALIQTNIGNLEKMKAAHGYRGALQSSKLVNERLVLEAAKLKPLDLIILPETAVPGYFTEDRPLNRAEMFELANKAGVPIAFGGYFRENRDPPKIFNSLFLISNYYQVLGHYDKVKLLYFGETYPFAQTFPQLTRWFPQIGNFARGTSLEPLQLSKELKFAPLICLEGIYPHYVRQVVKNGAQFIVTVTNDSWFGDTANPYQHRMLHVWRAIENKRPMLRVANTGITTFIDVTGKIRSQTPLFQEQILIDEVGVLNHETFYTRYGDVFVYSLIIFLIFLGIVFFRREIN